MRTLLFCCLCHLPFPHSSHLVNSDLETFVRMGTLCALQFLPTAVSAAVFCFCRQSRPLTSGPISGSPAWRSSNVTFFYGPSSNKPTNSSWDLVPDFFSLKFSVVLTLVNCRPVTVTLGHPNGLVLQELGAQRHYLSWIPCTHMVESENNFVSCSLMSKHALWPITPRKYRCISVILAFLPVCGHALYFLHWMFVLPVFRGRLISETAACHVPFWSLEL